MLFCLDLSSLLIDLLPLCQHFAITVKVDLFFGGRRCLRLGGR